MVPPSSGDAVFEDIILIIGWRAVLSELLGAFGRFRKASQLVFF